MKGITPMNVSEQIAKLSQELPPEKQTEVLNFVQFLVSRQARTTWTVERRRAIIARTMGCPSDTHTSSDAFALHKQEEKTQGEESRTQTRPFASGDTSGGEFFL
jgi:hypothetical protein